MKVVLRVEQNLPRLDEILKASLLALIGAIPESLPTNIPPLASITLHVRVPAARQQRVAVVKHAGTRPSDQDDLPVSLNMVLITQ